MSDRLPLFSIIVPVYKNEENIPALLEALGEFSNKHRSTFRQEVVFVVDGSPDNSALELRTRLPKVTGFQAELVLLSRNFGSFEAIRQGLRVARGDYHGVLAADLQEPLELLEQSFQALHSGEVDVCLGQRVSRADPLMSRITSGAFWSLYRRLIDPNVPSGGCDIFVITRNVSRSLIACQEQNSSLIGILFWLGFRRRFIPYERRAREAGVSAWTLRKKWKYLEDSLFSFSNLPIKFLMTLGFIGLLMSVFLTILIVTVKLLYDFPVPGYAATVTIVSFFGGLNSLGIGLIGEYVWRTLENTKRRPTGLVMDQTSFSPGSPPSEAPEPVDESRPAEAERT